MNFAGCKRPAARSTRGRIGFFLQPVKDDVVGGIQRLTDFLQDHAAFNLDFRIFEERVQQDIGDDIKAEGHVIFQHAGVIGCHLAAGVGVDIAPHILDRLGNGEGRPALGSLERHMFKEMGNAILFAPLVAAACQNPDADRGRFQAGHRFCGNAKPVGQSVNLNAQVVIRSRIRACNAARSLGTCVTRSGRSYRSAIRDGRGGLMPVAASTASGNLAGWAVARVTIGMGPVKGSAT